MSTEMRREESALLLSDLQLPLKVPQPYRRWAVSSNSDNISYRNKRLLTGVTGMPQCWCFILCYQFTFRTSPWTSHWFWKTWGIYCKRTKCIFCSVFCFAWYCKWGALCFLPEWDILLPQLKELGFFKLYNIRVWMIFDVSDTWVHHTGIKLMYPHVVCCCLMQ